MENLCGVGSAGISTNESVKNNIVEPLMKKIFGDAGKVKALFDEINKLSGIDVSTTGSKVKLYANTGSLAGIKDRDGNTGYDVDDLDNMTLPNVFKAGSA